MDPTALSIRHVVFPLWVRKNRSARLRYLAQLESSQYWSAEQIAEHQWLAFRKLIEHAYESCAFYRESFRRAGMVPADLRSREDIGRLPTITKQEIQENREAMISDRYPRQSLIQDMTGGSTGSPMLFHYDKDRHDSREAATLRHDRWTGWNIGERRAVLWGAPQDTKLTLSLGGRAREAFIERRSLLDASSLDPQAMRSFANRLLKYQPAVMLAYANTLGLFARYVLQEGIRGIAPRAIISSAEVLTPENRALAEQAFSCRVFNRYGSREFGVIASECGMHEGMHVNAENLLVEAPAGTNGEPSEIVITDLRNFAMPMIRYRIKDLGKLMPGRCACGRGLPRIDLAAGRVTDFLTAINGSRVSGIVLATYAITDIRGIRQVQFVQNTRDTVTINLVKGTAWSEAARAELLSRVHKFLGAEMHVEVEFREQIPLEKSGKYRFAISSLPERADVAGSMA